MRAAKGGGAAGGGAGRDRCGEARGDALGLGAERKALPPTRPPDLAARDSSGRAVEVKRLKWRAGVYEVPGEGLPIWSFDDVKSHAVEQVRLIVDWTGERIASEDVDDSRIANEYALRPKPKPGPESLVRQCEYSEAAAILVKAIELVRLREGSEVALSSTALWLVPSLLEEYLKLCGLAEFAPIGVGGTRKPYTKVMALWGELFSQGRVILTAVRITRPNLGNAP